MFQKLKKQKRIKNFEIQALRNVVWENGPDMVENFEKKFKEVKIEGRRKSFFFHNVHGDSTEYKLHGDWEGRDRGYVHRDRVRSETEISKK